MAFFSLLCRLKTIKTIFSFPCKSHPELVNDLLPISDLEISVLSNLIQNNPWGEIEKVIKKDLIKHGASRALFSGGI